MIFTRERKNNRKNRKTISFLMFSGGKKWEILEEMTFDNKSRGATWSLMFKNRIIVEP